MDLAQYLSEFENRLGRLVVVSGPSGVGKGTLVNRLLEVCKNTQRGVTCTTRDPRPGEIEGVDYYFIKPEQFREMIEKGEFLEYAQVHLNLYGTPVFSVSRTREKGIDVLLEIDYQGARAVKEKMPDTVMIFIAPPSMDELEQRLRGRGTESEEAVAKRLHNAQTEIDHIPMYDYLVVNDDIDTAAGELCSIITAERARVQTYEG